MPLSPIAALREHVSRSVVHRNHWLERFAAEVEFAENLAGMLGRATWPKQIEQAAAGVLAAAGKGRLDRIEKAVLDAEQSLAAIGKAAKRYTIHCAAHAHIDMNWMWSWPETVAVTLDTFAAMLRLMDEFDDFRFSQSQASVYEIARRFDPEMFARIQQRVAEGRWEVTAAHWVEGDKNLASGESLARHLLYTRRYFAEHFGIRPDRQPLDWEPDCFGHAAMIPAIDSRAAVRWYYCCRPGIDKYPPRVFWWEAPDGSRILVHWAKDWYNAMLDGGIGRIAAEFFRQTGLRDFLRVYGAGDHGGGPTRRDILAVRDMNAWPIFPKVRLARVGDFFAAVEKHAADLPVVEGELNFEFVGCYTSQSQIKKANRQGENHAVAAEWAAALAARAAGLDVPTTMLRDAWIPVLFGHFHDILPGSGVRETRQYQLGISQEAAATAHAVVRRSLDAVAAAVDTRFAGEPAGADGVFELVERADSAGVGFETGDGRVTGAARAAGWPRCFVVFNPTAFARTEVVTASVWDAGDGEVQTTDFAVRYPDGSVRPAQRVGEGDFWAHKFVKLAFPVAVGPLGYAAVAVERADRPVAAETALSVYQPQHGYWPGRFEMENEHLAVVFDPESGGIVRLVDKASGVDLADAARPMAVLEYLLEQPGGMSAWVQWPAQKRICPLQARSVRRKSTGPHEASVEVEGLVNDSTFTLLYTLRAGEPALHVEVRVNWLERGGPKIGTPALKLCLPLALRDAAARYEIPFGSIDRDINDGQEVPALRWADVHGKAAGGKAAGLVLANDCKYGHSLEGSTLRLTLLRSSFSPDPLPEVGQFAVQVALAPYSGKPDAARAVRLGAALNHPLQPVSTDAHDGRLPAAAAAVAVEPPAVVLSSVKRAEDRDALIFRLYETAGEGTIAKVVLDPALMGAVAEAVEVDLLERPLADSTAGATGDGFELPVKPFSIVSVMVTFAK